MAPSWSFAHTPLLYPLALDFGVANSVKTRHHQTPVAQKHVVPAVALADDIAPIHPCALPLAGGSRAAPAPPPSVQVGGRHDAVSRRPDSGHSASASRGAGFPPLRRPWQQAGCRQSGAASSAVVIACPSPGDSASGPIGCYGGPNCLRFRYIAVTPFLLAVRQGTGTGTPWTTPARARLPVPAKTVRGSPAGIGDATTIAGI